MRGLQSFCCLTAMMLLSVPSFATAPAGRYVAGSGTVLDRKTKLTWQQPASETTRNWADARDYCGSLGSNWRLPTIKELQTIVDYAQTAAPRIDTTAFPGTLTAWYWSSTPLLGSAAGVWAVSFNLGLSLSDSNTALNYVRCVH